MLGIIAYVDSGRREERKREIQILPQKVNQGCLIPFVHDARGIVWHVSAKFIARGGMDWARRATSDRYSLNRPTILGDIYEVRNRGYTGRVPKYNSTPLKGSATLLEHESALTARPASPLCKERTGAICRGPR